LRVVKIVESGIKIIDKLLGGFPFPSTILVILDPLSTPELFIYNLCRGGYYFAFFKSAKIIEEEIGKLGIELNVIEIKNEKELISKLEELKERRVVVEYGFEVELVRKIREIAVKNELLVYLCILRDWFDEKDLSVLKYLCDGVLIIECSRVGDKIIGKFSIPKMLFGATLGEFVRFKIYKGLLEIDTSKDIA